MNILIDTSVWIDYFRSGQKTHSLDFLIDENLIVTNDLILTELVPFLKVRSQKSLITLLEQIRRMQMHIDWAEIIEFQVMCLKNGINSIGIPDLLIVQNAIHSNSPIFSLDGHFQLIAKKTSLKIFNPKTI